MANIDILERPIEFCGWKCRIHFTRYKNGRPAIHLISLQGEPVATATINLPEAELFEGEILIKDYSENTGIKKLLIDAGILEETGKQVAWGYSTFPICRLTENASGAFRCGQPRRKS